MLNNDKIRDLNVDIVSEDRILHKSCFTFADNGQHGNEKKNPMTLPGSQSMENAKLI